jgi:hypothetical protein
LRRREADLPGDELTLRATGFDCFGSLIAIISSTRPTYLDRGPATGTARAAPVAGCRDQQTVALHAMTQSVFAMPLS